MKEFRDDKKKLELEIGEKLREFCAKYGVRVEDIEIENFYYVTDTDAIQVEIKVDL